MVYRELLEINLAEILVLWIDSNSITHTHALTLSFSLVSWSVHSKRSSPHTDSKEFADSITQAMEDMRRLFDA